MSSDIFCYQSWYSSTSSDVIKPKVGERADTVEPSMLFLIVAFIGNFHNISWRLSRDTAKLAVFFPCARSRDPKKIWAAVPLRVVFCRSWGCRDIGGAFTNYLLPHLRPEWLTLWTCPDRDMSAGTHCLFGMRQVFFLHGYMLINSFILAFISKNFEID